MPEGGLRRSDGDAGSGCYCVLTATLVVPRTLPPESLKRTKIRVVPGENAIAPAAVAKIEKVGVAPALTVIGP